MPTRIQLRRGTTAQVNAASLAAGEPMVDLTTERVAIGTGAGPGTHFWIGGSSGPTVPLALATNVCPILADGVQVGTNVEFRSIQLPAAAIGEAFCVTDPDGCCEGSSSSSGPLCQIDDIPDLLWLTAIMGASCLVASVQIQKTEIAPGVFGWYPVVPLPCGPGSSVRLLWQGNCRFNVEASCGPSGHGGVAVAPISVDPFYWSGTVTVGEEEACWEGPVIHVEVTE